jgi:hypothetical protein
MAHGQLSPSIHQYPSSCSPHPSFHWCQLLDRTETAPGKLFGTLLAAVAVFLIGKSTITVVVYTKGRPINSDAVPDKAGVSVADVDAHTFVLGILQAAPLKLSFCPTSLQVGVLYIAGLINDCYGY